MGFDNESLQSIKYSRGSFSVLDQLKVPAELVYRQILSVSNGVEAIQTMQVRGAPLIAVVGCLSIGIELDADLKDKNILSTPSLLLDYVKEQVDRLIAARPTAVNMKKEGYLLIRFVEESSRNVEDVKALKQK
jgi:methylthioribose-1-phosphate isomerase